MASGRLQAPGIRKTVAGTFVLIWLGINALGVYYISREHELVEETVLMVMRENGRSWAHQCMAALLAARPADVQGIVDGLVGGQRLDRAWVEDLQGDRVADSNPQSHALSPGDTGNRANRPGIQVVERDPRPEGFFHESGHLFELRFPVEHEGERLGTLGIEINTAWANQQAKELGIKGLWALFLVTAVFATIAVWVDRRLVDGIRQIDCVVQEIARGQFGQKIRLGTGDELAELGSSVNRMADVLRQSEVRVGHWKTQLERNVAERTQQLEESQALLAHREKMAALGLMAAGIAHEVVNPLAAISAIIQRIEWDAEPPLRDKCKIARQQILRISRTIDELRQFARPALGTEHTAIDINVTIRLTLQVCRYDPRGENTDIVTQLSDTLPSLRGNADRWQQVFLNLVLNAFDAMPRGGKLTVISRQRDDHVELIFRDTGIGMSREEISKLFHPFYTTKSPDRGSGLGLAVCQGIINSFGGRIEVESEPGKGAEFRIVIPAEPPLSANGAQSTVTTSQEQALPTAGALGKRSPSVA